MALPNLTGQNIEDSYQRVLHTDGVSIWDGTGSLITPHYTGTFVGNGAGITGITATAAPAGPTTAVQYNNAGSTGGSANFTYNGSNQVQLTGSLIATSITSSLQGSASYALTASYALNGGGSTPAFPYTGSARITGSLDVIGTTTLTGSFNVSGSTTQRGNNTLLGNTTLSGSVIISGSTTTPTTPTIKVDGDIETNGVIKFMPVNKNIDTSVSASYIYVSGSTNDLYFSQNGSGYNNVTRLRWLEGNLYTGLLRGGLITTQSSTVYQIASGSGIVVSLNASIQNDPYPIVQYLQWPNLSASIAPTSMSFDQTFVGINSSNNIVAQGIPFTDGEFNTLIPIGIVLHQNHSTINGVKTSPSVAYGWKQRSSDFIRAFGPLKISGYAVLPSGSSTGSLTIGSGEGFVDGANYAIDPNNPSYAVDNGTTTSKIFRYYQSGSDWVYNTNNGAGYEALDPVHYNPGGLGVLDLVGASNYSLQRVFWYPNSVTKAITVYYGNERYGTLALAQAGLASEAFNEAPNTAANAVYLGAFAIKGGTNTTLQNSTHFTWLPGGLFRGGGGSSGGTTNPGGSATQIQYNNAGAFGGVSTLTFDGTTLKATGSFTGSFVGGLTGTASYATQALSASWAPGSSATFPYTGNAVITGSLIVSGSTGTLNTSTAQWIADGTLYDINNVPSVLWGNGNRVLRDSSNNTTVDWGNASLSDSSGNPSVDWTNRILYEPGGTEALNFSTSASVSSQLYYNNLLPVRAQRHLAETPSYAGQTILASIDVGVSDYDLVALDTDGVWKATKATIANGASKMLGICVDTAGGYVLIEGDVGVSDDDSQGAYVINADHGLPVYISANTGRMTTTAPSSVGELVRIVGHIYYQSTTDVNWWTMKFRPSNDWYEI